MRNSGRYLAFLSYLLVLIGSLGVLLFKRDNEFAVYHARQSLLLSMIAVLTPVAWVVVSWFVTWIPLVGGVVAAALFSIVILVYIMIAIAWIAGMLNALQAKTKPVPMFGGWVERLLNA